MLVHQWKRNVIILAVLAVLGVAFGAMRRAPGHAPDDSTLASISVIIDVGQRQLRVVDGTEVLASYPVAVGAARHPTPRGSFLVRRIIWNPRWVPPEADWAKGKQAREPGDPDNPMGRVKIFFQEPDYYIHGTHARESIGQAESHGCVRMLNPDVIALARTLMNHGEAPVPPGFIRRIINAVTRTREVRLTRPVPLRVES